MVVKCDDICFYISFEIESTDGDFVRSEYGDEELIKRSSRAGDLKKEFRVEEMSSISTSGAEHYPVRVQMLEKKKKKESSTNNISASSC